MLGIYIACHYKLFSNSLTPPIVNLIGAEYIELPSETRDGWHYGIKHE